LCFFFIVYLFCVVFFVVFYCFCGVFLVFLVWITLSRASFRLVGVCGAFVPLVLFFVCFFCFSLLGGSLFFFFFYITLISTTYSIVGHFFFFLLFSYCFFVFPSTYFSGIAHDLVLVLFLVLVFCCSGLILFIFICVLFVFSLFFVIFFFGRDRCFFFRSSLVASFFISESICSIVFFVRYWCSCLRCDFVSYVAFFFFVCLVCFCLGGTTSIFCGWVHTILVVFVFFVLLFFVFLVFF